MLQKGREKAQQLLDLWFAPQRARPTADSGEGNELIELAIFHGVAPLLWLQVRAQTQESLLPALTRGRLESLYRENCLRNLRLAAEQSRLLADLEAAGIRAWGLKGPALSEQLYGDIGARQISDLDLLIEPASLARADALLARLGYVRNTRGEIASLAEAQELIYVRAPESPRPVFLDLHQRLLPYVPHDPLAGRVFEQGMTRENLLLYLCANQITHRFARLRYLCDVVAFLEQEGPATDWDEFLRAARKMPFVPGISLCLRWAAEAGGARVPQSVAVALAPDALGSAVLRRTLGRDINEALARGRALDGPAGAPVIFGAGSPGRARLALAWRLVFPSRAYLREQSGIGAGQRLVPVYAGRLVQKFTAVVRHLFRTSI
jgi:hypothetical protein